MQCVSVASDISMGGGAVLYTVGLSAFYQLPKMFLEFINGAIVRATGIEMRRSWTGWWECGDLWTTGTDMKRNQDWVVGECGFVSDLTWIHGEFSFCLCNM